MIWQDVIPRVNLALKITNWCNLCCAHCCERSHRKEPFNLMPINQVEKHIIQYVNMDVPVWDYVVFTGGESMAPYYCGMDTYVPNAAEISIKNKLTPAFKTNAKWDAALAKRILKDLADVAHKYNHQISLDISIDEYHDNFLSAANVVDQIMSSQYLIDAIPVSFIGLNTAASQYKYQEFANILRQRGIHVGQMDTDGTIVMSKGDNLNVMFYEIGALSRLGRAADNNLTQHIPSGHPNIGDSDCLEITNTNQAILNYKYKTAMDNKTVAQVYDELLQKKR